MDVYSLVNGFRTAIAQDSTISTWSNITYGQGVTVYNVIDTLNPPTEDNSPYVVVTPIGHLRGRALRDKSLQFGVFVALADSSIKASTIDNYNEYAGDERVLTLYKYVEDAIVGVDIGNLRLNPIEGEFMYDEAWPWFIAIDIYQIEGQVPISTDPLS